MIALWTLLTLPGGEPPPSFARDVRPLLSDHCFACHGPDATTREADLRLDRRDAALDPTRRIVVPGDPDSSALWQRISAHDPGERMPPPEAEHGGEPLSEAGRDVLRRWIAAGAPWQEHWSFVPPERPAVPTVLHADRVADPIDAFVLERLEAEGLALSPEADRATLLRRATLDLTGLPPTPTELDAFLADDAPGAWDRALDRLFASPRHGEHMARPWLDAARYADTHGLHLDNERSMWPYRDWVVRAFQQNLPYDRFVIEQLAGDLLPDATVDQRIASGFNRCNPTSAEGGMIAEEYLALYAKDRVDTTATVFLGLSLACARCHDHKYDPFTQRDYYGLYAFFNSLAEEASDRNISNPVPFLRVPDAAQAAELARQDARIAELAADVDAPHPEIDAAQERWEREQRARLAERWRILVPEAARAAHGTTLAVLPDDSVLATGANPETDVFEVTAHAGEQRITALRLELRNAGDALDLVPGRAHNRNFAIGGVEVEAWPAGHPELAQRVALATAASSHDQEGFPASALLDDDPQTAWAGLGAVGPRHALLVPAQPFGFPGGTGLRLRLRCETRFAGHAPERFRWSVASDPALVPSTAGAWSQAGPVPADDARAALDAATGDAPGPWVEVPQLVDGAIHEFPTVVGLVHLRRVIDAPTARTLVVGLGSDDGVRVWRNGAPVHANPTPRVVALDQDRVELPLRAGANVVTVTVANYGGGFAFAWRTLEERPEGEPHAVELALADAPGARGPEADRAVRDAFRRRHAPRWMALADELAAARTQRAALEASLPTTLVSEELAEPRPAFVLRRGQYDQPGEPVARAVPAVFAPLAADAPRDRLGLARWLVARENPLTARVWVNRLWAQLFGSGLARTPEDLGSQGRFPTHPELLDWLACELVDSGWDTRAVLRHMLRSSTYRQSSRCSPELLARDPDDLLLARAPRWRLDGEVLRDSALALSGLLVERVGGPPVRPYQPPGIWRAVGYTTSNTANYVRDDGDALWRRSLYTFWKRTAPPPSMTGFDAPSREACSVGRARTNTPLQALVLLNDPQFVEAARAFGRRALAEGGADDDARLAWLFRSATARTPDTRERELLRAALAEQRAHFAARPDAARALLAVGDTGLGDTAQAEADPELAAWAQLASLLLNLDEAVTRG